MSYQTFDASLPYVDALHDELILLHERFELSLQRGMKYLKLTADEQEDHHHPMMDALSKVGNLQKTVNGAVAHRSTNDACLDLYYQLGVNLDTGHIYHLLENAWLQDPERTLRIIWHTRSIHQGKSAKYRFYVAFGWLLMHHPQTAIHNLPLLVAETIEVEKRNGKALFKCHGYWKDLLNVCQIYANGELEDGPKGEGGRYQALNCLRIARRPWIKGKSPRERSCQFYKSLKACEFAEEQQAMLKARKEAIDAQQAKQRQEQREAKMNKRAKRHDRIVDLLTNNTHYRVLHCTVARLFAAQLRKDLELLKASKVNELSLAAKWAPSLQQTHDKHTLMATSIAELLFPPAEYQERDQPRQHYLNKVRERYRKEYLSPLRAALDVTERRMSSGEWTSINFSRVPSLCMQNNSQHFYKHAPQQFRAFLQDVVAGKRQVSGATLQPCQLAERAVQCCNGSSTRASKLGLKVKENNQDVSKELIEIEKTLIDAQWRTLVESIRQHASLGQAIAVLDTSGSMMCSMNATIVPLYPAIGLALLLAELVAPPFGNSIITFSSTPSVVNLAEIPSFCERVKSVLRACAGMSTNIEAVFLDLLLPIAKKHKLKQEDMVKRLFIFSDMEFDVGCRDIHSGTSTPSGSWATTYERIKAAYEAEGYTVPEIVWWNLAGTRPTDDPSMDPEAPKPVTQDTPGCAMLCGYSGALMKNFLEGKVGQEEEEYDMLDDNDDQPKKKSELTPLESMDKAISHSSFKDLVVVD